MTTPHVVIVGGGLAGIAAAVGLARHSFRVTLLESRPRLGGRATSIVDRETGELIDNCQHVNMGCCVNFQRLCEWTGTSEHLVTEDELIFIASYGKQNRLRNGFLPAPAHLSTGFLRLSYLSFQEKRSLARAMLALLRSRPPESGRFIDFLRQHRQSRKLIDRFWNSVLVSALSEDLERISYLYARKVFVEGFLANRSGWKVQLLDLPLGQFYDEAIRNWLAEHGVTVRIQSGLQSLEQTEDRLIRSARLRDESILEADEFVLAVAFDRVPSLLPAVVAESETGRRVSEIEAASISSVHVWFDREITTLRHAVLLDRLSQWMFNRSRILGARETDRFAYQIVISNSRDLEMSQDELIDRVRDELAEIFPASKEAQLLHARVITEHRAVFSVVPGVDELRPPQQTLISNLQLAGDWTQTGWPATMVGAVRSGFLAAENLLKKYRPNQSSQLLAPELKTSPIVRMLSKTEPVS